MDAIDVLVDAFGRARSDATRAVDGLTAADLVWRPDDEANPIAWLVWHLTRVQDDHLAELAGSKAREAVAAIDHQIGDDDHQADREHLSPHHGWRSELRSG